MGHNDTHHTRIYDAGKNAPTSESTNDRTFVSETDLSPDTAGKPTVSEITTFASLENYTDTILVYNGTDADNNEYTYVYNVDGSGNVTLLKEPAPEATANISGSIEIRNWTAETVYATGETVKTPTGALVKRVVGGTSGTVFNATEAAEYTVIAADANVHTWAPNLYFYVGQHILIDDYITLERTTAGFTPDYFETDMPNWELRAQAGIRPFAPSTDYMKDTLIVEGLVIYQNKYNQSGSSTFSPGGPWEQISYSPILMSPDGNTTRRVSIDNSGNLVAVAV